MKIEISGTIQFYDTDCGGVVSNIAYLRYVEQARSALFEALGMGLVEMNESRLFPAVIRTEIDYRSPARLGDEMKIFAALSAVEKVRATCEFTLEVEREPGEATLLATAKQFVALVQMPSGRPRRMPEEWKSLSLRP
ncbi:MAG: thioesterase family protein [Verrucomicrobiales bacterium]|nr:thioesterase family protein [Verrucomicrobiales bacterium]